VSHPGTHSPRATRDAILGAVAVAVCACVSIATASIPPAIDSALVVPGPEPGIAFAAPGGLAIDAAHGEILIANTGAHRVDVIGLDGRARAHYIHRVQQPDGTWVDGLPVALSVDGRGRTLVVDNLAPYLDIVDFRGRSIARLAIPRSAGEPEEALGPAAVAVARDGSILVGSRGASGRVFMFTPELALVRVWGVPGRDSGQIARITGLAATPDGHVVVLCLDTQRAVQIFESDGRFIRGFGVHDIGEGNFSFPSSVAVTDDGRIWVSDEIRQLVQVFDFAGRFLGAVGRVGSAPGEFLYPCALATDGKARLAVAERVSGRIQLLTIR
jgi:hypothetical protein